MSDHHITSQPLTLPLHQIRLSFLLITLPCLHNRGTAPPTQKPNPSHHYTHSIRSPQSTRTHLPRSLIRSLHHALGKQRHKRPSLTWRCSTPPGNADLTTRHRQVGTYRTAIIGHGEDRHDSPTWSVLTNSKSFEVKEPQHGCAGLSMSLNHHKYTWGQSRALQAIPPTYYIFPHSPLVHNSR